MNNFILTLAIIAQITGLSLPQILEDNFYVLPSYDEENVLEIKTEPEIILPVAEIETPKKINDLDFSENDLQSKSAIVADVKTGQILYEKNANSKVSIASLTKLMTSLVFLDHNPGWDHKHKMQSDENYLIGAKLQIDNDQELTTHDLLRTTLVGSANNTAKALSRSTGLNDDEFKKAMNNKVEFLGLENSEFVEPTGLNAGNKSSARDLVRIFREVISYDSLRETIALKKHALEIPPDNHVHEVKSTNKLLKDDEIDVIGGKTGFTYEAGYCLATLSKNEAGNEIIVITLGLPTESARDYENKKLINWTFNNYNWN